MRRALLLLFGGVVLAVELALALGSGGWLADHSLLEAGPDWFEMVSDDPLLLGAGIDFLALMLIVLVLLLAQVPPERRWGVRTWVFLPVYLFIPSIGIVVYLLYVHPQGIR